MLEKLSPQEEQALQAVFATGEGNVKMFLENLQDAVPYTTLASTIKNLEKKGYLQSRSVGNAYLYKPTMSEGEYKKQFMNGVVKNYFDNSYKELVNFFVEQKKLSPKELKEIIEMIENPQELAAMGEAARKLAKEDAASATADIIEQLAAKR